MTRYQQRISDLFQSIGYRVRINATLSGFTGKHEIDMVLDHKSPFGEKTFLVRVLDDGKHAGAPDVKELARELNDLGYGTGVIVASADPTQDAIQTADRYGIKLVGGSDLKQLEKYGRHAHCGLDKYLEPLMDIDKAKKHVEKMARKNSGGRIFGRGKPKQVLDGIVAFHYPYYDLTIEHTETREVGLPGSKKVVKTTRTYKQSMDACTGAFVFCDRNGITYQCGSNFNEVRILRAIGKGGSIKELLSLNLDPAATQTALKGLANRHLIEAKNVRPEAYRVLVAIPKNLRSITECCKAFKDAPDGTTIDVIVSAEDAAAMVTSRGGRVVRIDTVYVPYYVATYDTESQKSMDVVNAMGRSWSTASEVPDEVRDRLKKEANPRGRTDDAGA